MFFPCVGHCFSIVQNHLRYRFETCIFKKVEFMAKSGFEIAPNFSLIHLISRIYPKWISVNMHLADTIDTAEKAMALIGSV